MANKNIENDEIFQVGELFRELLDKYNKVENKKRLYKGLEELTLAEINTIIIIGRKDEMVSMSEIANSLGVSFGTPTVTIDRLIKKEVVERIRDIEDRRQVFIKLSEKGENIFKDIMKLKYRLTEKIFSILTKEERNSAIQLLHKLNSNFEQLISSE